MIGLKILGQSMIRKRISVEIYWNSKNYWKIWFSEPK